MEAYLGLEVTLEGDTAVVVGIIGSAVETGTSVKVTLSGMEALAHSV
jgi:hypothetical protein